MESRGEVLTTMRGQLKKVAALARHTQRERYGQALIEGPQAVRELVAWHPELIRDLYITPSAGEREQALVQSARASGCYMHWVEQEILQKVSANCQGWLAVINQPEPICLDHLFTPDTRLVAYCPQMNDPGNLGTVIRSADAAGADGLITGRGSVDIFNPKVVRSCVGSLFHLPVLSGYTDHEVISRAKEAGLMVVCADARGDHGLYDSPSLYTDGFDLRRPTLWLVGNEAHGLSPEQRQLADYCVSIPMWGSSESLNAAVATSLCLYASARAQRMGEE